jgi:hypothetical protein
MERFSKDAFYKCLTSIEDIKARAILKVYPRPGTNQWIYLSNAYLLSIQKNNSSGLLNSFLIHKFQTNFNLIIPKTVQAKFNCCSPFFAVFFVVIEQNPINLLKLMNFFLDPLNRNLWRTFMLIFLMIRLN